jgi:hypothetical protein
MVQQDLDDILEAATSVKLVSRIVREMELDRVEMGTCALIVDHAVGVILESIERIEESLDEEETRD